ncbi:domon-like type 9 carbohydrate-binding module domain [Lecanosticta acicola]|uniref:Domon-like type 9 carbohydrate-binding module domain n=1 Tax=Lecanosticta acicola TaxID=111012 RepID=A0AAI9EAE0_9PEZI|nr:domon-like type 9 carbohydrate-binding module domain [Lecanosticta acicola]
MATSRRLAAVCALISCATFALADVPSIRVPACPSVETIHYNHYVPYTLGDGFPSTQVALCYDDTSIHLKFTAHNETNYFYNKSAVTNDPIYKWEVMEAFIYRGENDPKTYMEFEIAPNNVTFNAFIYNPSKVRASGAPFDTFYIQTPVEDGLTARTTLDKEARTWVSAVKVPLGFFNVDDGRGKGTKWRMNFFRTVVAPSQFPNQTLGAWSPTDEANFHMTPFFGRVAFV